MLEYFSLLSFFSCRLSLFLSVSPCVSLSLSLSDSLSLSIFSLSLSFKSLPGQCCRSLIYNTAYNLYLHRQGTSSIYHQIYKYVLIRNHLPSLRYTIQLNVVHHVLFGDISRVFIVIYHAFSWCYITRFHGDISRVFMVIYHVCYGTIPHALIVL